MATDILWLSPTDFVTGDKSLRISYPSVTHPAVEIKVKAPGDLKWIYLGLRVPPDHDIHAIHVCYQLSNSRSFISQVRLVEMQTPDQAVVRHDDGTNLLSATPICYRSQIMGGYRPGGAALLQLRLNFGNIADAITLGAIGVEVLPTSTIQGNVPYINVASLGILPNNTASQNSDAIEAALAAIPNPGGVVIGQRWLFGAGTYFFARTIEITRSMMIMGATGMGFGATIFKFPAGVTGIILHSYESAGVGNRADWTVLSDLYIVALGKTTTAHGIFCKGFSPRLENVEVLGFAGDGFRINASVNVAPVTNANLWRMFNCRSVYNGNNGLFVQGGDSNAGICIGLDTSDNGAWGIYEDSFLGNTYVGIHSASNALGGYWARGASQRNMFLNCYSEGNEGPSQIDFPNMVLGGLIPSGVTGDCVKIVSGEGNPLRFSMTGGSKSGSVAIGSIDGVSKAYLSFSNSDDTHPLRFKYGQSYGGFNSGFYAFNVADINGWSGLMIAGQNAQLTSWPMAPFPGRPVFDTSGFYLDQNKMSNGSAEPSTGTNNVGDVHFNTVPISGGKAGWVCTTSGTAGIYAEGLTATADGTAAVILSAPSVVLRVGDMLTINGDTKRVIAISGAAVTMSGNITAGTGLAIQYAPPGWKTFGLID